MNSTMKNRKAVLRRLLRLVRLMSAFRELLGELVEIEARVRPFFVFKNFNLFLEIFV